MPIVLLLLASCVLAQDTGKPKPANPLNPLNPLTSVDPFVGTFEGEEMAITITKAQGGYAGDVRRAGQSFPFTATRQGDLLSGIFEFQGEKFEFFVTVTSEGVTFNTPLKLKRTKTEAGKPAASDNTTPAKNIPTTGTLTPATPTTPGKTTPATPAVVIPKPVLPLPPVKPKRVTFEYNAKAGRSWEGFPTGAYVIMEDASGASGELPDTKQTAMIYKGTEGGLEKVQSFRGFDGQWIARESLLTWLDQCKEITELGYKAGDKSSDTLEIDGQPVKCDVTTYSRDDRDLKGKPITLRLQIWTAPGVSLPAQALRIPEGAIVLPANAVRLVTLGEEWVTSCDFKLTKLRHKHRIAGEELTVAVFEGFDKTATGNSTVEIATTRFISAQVPGSIVRFSSSKRDNFNNAFHTTGSVTHIGIAKTPADLPPPPQAPASLE